MRNTPQLILPKAYIREATEMIRQAKHRINIMTLIFIDDETTAPFVEALRDAAQRGVKVTIAADTFTYTEFQAFRAPTSYKSERLRDSQKTQKALRTAGAHFHWLGRYTPFAFAGRTHIKWSIIDDTVYSFGGVNIYKRGVTNIDYMLEIKNQALADRLSGEHTRIISADRSGHAYPSFSFGDDDSMVLIDGGFWGDSIIYRRACNLARQAEHILFVSQYCPTGKLSRLIKQKPSDLYFNHFSSTTLLNKFVIRLGMKFSGQKTAFHRRKYLHAKFIIFTMPDGKKVAITGSHNFVRAGMYLGTREVAFETSNRKVIKQLEQFFVKYVK